MKKIVMMLLAAVACSAVFTLNGGNLVEWSVDRAVFQNRPAMLLTLAVGEGTYIYAESLAVAAADQAGNPLEMVFAPVPADKKDDFAATAEETVKVFPAGTYRWVFCDDIPQAGDPAIEEFSCSITYQACIEPSETSSGECRLPVTVKLDTANTVSAAEAAEAVEDFEAAAAAVVAEAETEERVSSVPWEGFEITRKAVGYMDSSDFLGFLEAENTQSAPTAGFWVMLIAAILGGLALNLTPCVLPLIPVNIAVIGAGEGRKGLGRAFVYGLGMVAAYGILGVLAALVGVPMSVLSANWGFNIFAGAVFILLAAALVMGKMDMSGSSGRFVKKLLNDNKAALPAVFLLGVLAAVLAGACVAPVAAAVLAWTALAAGDGAWYALIIPFALGAGMALPWPLVGAGLKILPKPGSWMEWVKRGFAVFIILLGLWYIWLGIQISPWYGNEDLYDGGTPSAVMEGVRVTFEEAEKSGKPVLLDFTAQWCKNCKVMEKTVFTDNDVAEALEDFQFYRVDVTDNSPVFAGIVDFCGITALPSFVVLEKTENNGE